MQYFAVISKKKLKNILFNNILDKRQCNNNHYITNHYITYLFHYFEGKEKMQEDLQKYDYAYDCAVYIGRFQPAHYGHAHVIKRALEVASQVVVILGSADSPRTLHDPFSDSEREMMLRSYFDSEINDKINICPIVDNKIIETWINDVVTSVNNIIGSKRVVLVGHTKDDSSYYLKLFPNWDVLEVENYQNIDATYIREVMFNNESLDQIQSLACNQVIQFLSEFCQQGYILK